MVRQQRGKEAATSLCASSERGMSAITFLHGTLQRDALLRTYSNIIRPIPDYRAWDEEEIDDLQPPVVKVQPGRPKGARAREVGSPKSKSRRGSYKCSYCNQIGHNKGGCPVNPNRKRKHNETETGTRGMETEAGTNFAAGTSQSQR